MALGYVVVAILAAAIVIFAFQNGMPVAVRFLAWTLPAAPVAALILISVVIGLIVAAIPLWVQRWRLRARVRTLETQIRQLETALADRDRALLAQRSRGLG